MSGTTTPSGDAADQDARLIDEAVAAIGEARAQAPRDYLLVMAVLLTMVALALIVVGVVADGVAQDLALNLGSEVIGALLTVVVIDGLWRRLERGTSASLKAMAKRIQEQRGRPMTDDERQAWGLFIEGSRGLTRDRSLIGRITGVRSFGRRVEALERQGNDTLSAFDPRKMADRTDD